MALPSAPLAYRLRPRSLSEFVGQADIVGEGTALRAAIDHDTLQSVLLSGPPGSGKTTLAHIIAGATKAEFVILNAVTSGVKDIKEVCVKAAELRRGFHTKTVLFIDEIHRFNKSQQDALLPFVENGTVILVGATTENPYFEVNAALVSRSHVYLLTPHTQAELLVILRRALESEQGFAGKVAVEEKALERIALAANGDARSALNLLELTALTAGAKVSLADAEKLMTERNLRYDRSGEEHYNVISAFIKTLRGSDVDAALFWLHRMIISGEHPDMVFRRMAIFASEDIGMADQDALPFVMHCWEAFARVGYPEGEYFLSHACVRLATSPKSNAVKRAMAAVKHCLHEAPSLEVPLHLRNAPVKGMADQGYGKGYRYPHDDAAGVVRESYFPEGMSPRTFFEPSEHGAEKELSARLRAIRETLGDRGE